ncbi:MAG: DUF1844 domain-containing protein [Desulfobacterales bacterium]
MAEEKKDFNVKGERTSSEENEIREDKEKSAADSSGVESDGESVKSASERKMDQNTQLPKITFSTFIFSLNSSALFHLGLVPDPTTGQKEKNLLLAKQSIDIIGMLDEKTQGNLTADEEKLVRNVLHDLRLMYVKEKG